MNGASAWRSVVTAAVVAVLGLWTGRGEASSFGVNAHIPSDHIADEVAAAGIEWVRIDVVWAIIEPTPNAYDWQRYDQLLDRLEGRGLRIFATVWGTPLWATSGSEFSGVPENQSDWIDFCYLLASRYHQRVDAWGFWNEPNLDHFWEGSRSQYLDEILLPGIEAVRTVDPDATVVGPDLAHLVSADWAGWLADIVTNTRDLLDVVTHHVYPSDGTSGDVGEKLNEGGQFPWDPPSVQSVLAGAGWNDRPVWLTETGVESDQYGEDGQESFYVGLLEDWFGVDRSNTWLGRVFFYEMSDPGNDPSISFGILRGPPTHERKLAFYGYTGFIHQTEEDDAEITIFGVPPTMGSRESVPVEIEVRNTGTTTWRAEDGYYLIFDVDEFGWISSVEPVAVTEPVAPTETRVLTGRLASPPIESSQPNRSVRAYARLVRLGGPRFGDEANRMVIHTAHVPLEVLANPAAAAAPFNGSATFSVEVHSESPVSYQWRRHTVPLIDDHRRSGTSGPVLLLTGIGWADQGDYDCVVTNAAGRVVTAPAPLAIEGSPIRRATGRVRPGGAAVLGRWLEFRAGGSSRGPSSLTAHPRPRTRSGPE